MEGAELPVEIGLRDGVVVDQRQSADPGAGKTLCGIAADTAET